MCRAVDWGELASVPGLILNVRSVGGIPTFFMLSAQKNPGELLSSPGGIGMLKGDICHFLFFVFKPYFKAFDCLVQFGGGEG